MKIKSTKPQPHHYSALCAAPASVWGYKGCAGKGGKTLNASIPVKENTNKEMKNND
jgi:hypothetical protein